MDGISTSPGFVARVVAAAAEVPPARPWLDLARAWWTVPIAGALATGALVWALGARPDIERARAVDVVHTATRSSAAASTS